MLAQSGALLLGRHESLRVIVGFDTLDEEPPRLFGALRGLEGRALPPEAVVDRLNGPGDGRGRRRAQAGVPLRGFIEVRLGLGERRRRCGVDRRHSLLSAALGEELERRFGALLGIEIRARLARVFVERPDGIGEGSGSPGNLRLRGRDRVLKIGLRPTIAPFGEGFTDPRRFFLGHPYILLRAAKLRLLGPPFDLVPPLGLGVLSWHPQTLASLWTTG